MPGENLHTSAGMSAQVIYRRQLSTDLPPTEFALSGQFQQPVFLEDILTTSDEIETSKHFFRFPLTYLTTFGILGPDLHRPALQRSTVDTFITLDQNPTYTISATRLLTENLPGYLYGPDHINYLINPSTTIQLYDKVGFIYNGALCEGEIVERLYSDPTAPETLNYRIQVFACNDYTVIPQDMLIVNVTQITKLLPRQWY